MEVPTGVEYSPWNERDGTLWIQPQMYPPIHTDTYIHTSRWRSLLVMDIIYLPLPAPPSPSPSPLGYWKYGSYTFKPWWMYVCNACHYNYHYHSGVTDQETILTRENIYLKKSRKSKNMDIVWPDHPSMYRLCDLCTVCMYVHIHTYILELWTWLTTNSCWKLGRANWTARMSSKWTPDQHKKECLCKYTLPIPYIHTYIHTYVHGRYMQCTSQKNIHTYCM